MSDIAQWAVPADGGESSRWGELLPLRPAPVRYLKIDLSRLAFADPLFLVRLRAFIDWHTSRGHEIQVERPRSHHVRNYLARMGVCDDLPDGCDFDVGSVQAQDRRNVLIPLMRLFSQAESDQLDYALGDLFDAQFTGKLIGLRDAFTATVGEMCDNATTHGRSDHGTYVIAQRFEGKRCVLAIGDLGIGIPEHLRRAHPELRDDGTAIAEATKERVTGVLGDEAALRGNGYDYVLTTMQETKVPKGLLRIWAGGGRFSLQMTDGRRTMSRGQSTNDHTCGTWVRLELHSM